MADTARIEALDRFYEQLNTIHESAFEWMSSAKNSREHEFWRALHRHAKGAQTAIAVVKYEIEVAQR